MSQSFLIPLVLLICCQSKYVYEVTFEVSSLLFSGTDDSLWFRLCNDNNECGLFQEIVNGFPTKNELYDVNYTSNIDLGDISSAGSLTLLTAGNDHICLSDIYVDGTNYDAGFTPECIDAGDNIYPRAECEALTVDFESNDWNIDASNPCEYTYEYNQTTTVPPVDAYTPAVAERLTQYSMASYCTASLDIGSNGWDCDICLEQPQMRNVTTVQSKDFPTNSAEGFVGYDPIYGPSIVIAFAGTDPTSIEDWITDLSVLFLNYSEYILNSNGGCTDCKVHKGFYESYASISSQVWDVVAALREYYGNQTKLVITGHSLGGAMATHCAIDAVINYEINPEYIYTFGAPRIGNDNFADYYANIIPNLYRVTFKKDPVPHLPFKSWTYSHLPNEIYYPDDFDEYIVCDGSGEDDECADRYKDTEALDVTDHLEYMDFDFVSNFLSCTVDGVVSNTVSYANMLNVNIIMFLNMVIMLLWML